MRLARQTMTKIPQLRAEVKPSGYVGTETEYKPYAALYGHISPVRDDYSIGVYGERVSRMHSVIFEAGTDVKSGDKLIIFGEKCTVLSIMRYSSHITVTAERTGVYECRG